MRRFSKVLIANRGEIAVRLIRACQRLQLQSVAVFSDADADALHVALADEAIHIGAAEARESYLNIDALVAAAKQTGAGAIHPGYGFLAENAAFAQRCVDEGIVFVGPSPQVIASMGAKIEAKRIAEQANVHCVPGYHGDDQSDETLLAAARRIGTPLLIKASAGGGGRGMRRIDDLDTFEGSLALARDEARAAFGDPAVLLEKYVEAPRHIEVQILADSHGNVRHLFERDCSAQRNYQKVIEEAPAPNLSAALRQQMLDDAVKLAQAIGYDNAGTVEFVVDAANDAAYFLEMNTRLQVEHPVTEMITGIDLAEWQLRVAAGDVIDFAQDDVAIQGHAVEARVAAENPAEGYRPETGQIGGYAEPDLPGLRIDSGIREGSAVSPYYDSMLAKVIAHGRNRDEAIRRLQQGLAAYRIGGVGVNLGFLYDVLGLPAFCSGEHLTSLLAEAWPDGWVQPQPGLKDLAHAALAWHIRVETQGRQGLWSSLGGWRLGEQLGYPGNATYYLQGADPELVELRIEGRAGNYRVAADHQELLKVSHADWREACLSYRQAGVRCQVPVWLDAKRAELQSGATRFELAVLLAEDALLVKQSKAPTHANAVTAPTPGLVAEVRVTEGEFVNAGQPLLVLEAMKLFQELTAPRNGRIAGLHCHPGDSVNSGDLLVSFADEDAQDDETVRAESA